MTLQSDFPARLGDFAAEDFKELEDEILAAHESIKKALPSTTITHGMLIDRMGIEATDTFMSTVVTISSRYLIRTGQLKL